MHRQKIVHVAYYYCITHTYYSNNHFVGEPWAVIPFIPSFIQSIVAAWFAQTRFPSCYPINNVKSTEGTSKAQTPNEENYQWAPSIRKLII